MSGYDKMKETSRNLEFDSSKLSVSMQRKFYEDKAGEAGIASLKVEESLNVESAAASSKSHDVGKVENKKKKREKNMNDNLKCKGCCN